MVTFISNDAVLATLVTMTALVGMLGLGLWLARRWRGASGIPRLTTDAAYVLTTLGLAAVGIRLQQLGINGALGTVVIAAGGLVTFWLNRRAE